MGKPSDRLVIGGESQRADDEWLHEPRWGMGGETMAVKGLSNTGIIGAREGPVRDAVWFEMEYDHVLPEARRSIVSPHNHSRVGGASDVHF